MKIIVILSLFTLLGVVLCADVAHNEYELAEIISQHTRCRKVGGSNERCQVWLNDLSTALQEGANPNNMGPNNMGPYPVMFMTNDPAVVQLLLDYGANYEATATAQEIIPEIYSWNFNMQFNWWTKVGDTMDDTINRRIRFAEETFEMFDYYPDFGDLVKAELAEKENELPNIDSTIDRSEESVLDRATRVRQALIDQGIPIRLVQWTNLNQVLVLVKFLEDAKEIRDIFREMRLTALNKKKLALAMLSQFGIGSENAGGATVEPSFDLLWQVSDDVKH